MKSIFYYFLVSSALFMLILSCTREEQFVDVPESEYSFLIECELPVLQQSDDAVKGSLGSFISANWTVGDKISVINLTKGKILGGDLTANNDGIISSFSGNVSGTIEEGDVLAFFYPSFNISSETVFQPTRFDISSQSNSEDVQLCAYGSFVASATGSSITNKKVDFTYAISYLKLNMANLPAGKTITNISLLNVPNGFTLSINEDKTDFVVATEEEKAEKNKIDISDSLTISAAGTIAAKVGVVPSNSSTDRIILVTIDSEGDYASSLTSAELLNNKYYNTIASGFDKISLPGKNGYGVYDMANGTVLDEYVEFESNLISGTEDTESDFALINMSTNSYWTLLGIPSNAIVGSTFPARLNQNGIPGCPEGIINDAKVKMMLPEGDFFKLWIKAGDYIFIVRK